MSFKRSKYSEEIKRQAVEDFIFQEENQFKKLLMN
jgi:hypothetical protein